MEERFAVETAHGTVRALLSVLIATAVGVAAIALVTSGEEKPTTPLEWGIYRILWDASKYGDQLDAEFARFASKPRYVMFYRDLEHGLPPKVLDAIDRRGATPIVSLELWRWHDSTHPYLPDIVDGKFDAFFRRQAETCRKFRRRVLLRFGFEFNGDWFTWSQDPRRFVAAWRRAHDLFRAAGADNVKWVWAPNVTSVPDRPENDMHRYWPGDRYVDWVAVDGYNWGPDHDQWHVWQSFEDIFEPALDQFARRYPRHQVMIAETGCVEGKPGQKARWLREAFTYLQRRPAVRAVVWFDLDKRREGEPDWRIATTPEALTAFNATFAATAKNESEPRP